MIDILYLGVNMGNAGYRFFCRYPEAKQDYYNTFRWLKALQEQRLDLKIAIKHHSGDYNQDKDFNEMSIMFGSRIKYIDSQEDSYEIANNSKMLVSYCSTMILEYQGMANLAHFIYNKRHKRFNIARKCRKFILPYGSLIKPAFYLDPNHRNRQFCMYIDDVCKHDCSYCKGVDLEIYDPYRLCTYDQFKNKVQEIINV